jgi:dTDP-4-amino-4,6-dideoxygalactose transaminase
MSDQDKINVTRTFLPPKEEYDALLTKVWDSMWITNNGPMVKELEDKLKKHLGVKHLFFVTNGTIALQIAMKALDLKEDIITTPFSYVATTSSIVWEGLNPVFSDIDKDSFNIDPRKIESKITDKTSGIVATHVFGNPCCVEEIEVIAKKNKLKTIYDAAHAFDVSYNDQSILNYGDISTLSFHATKVFHSVEGGAVITNDDELALKIAYLRNFGHNGQEKFHGLGINGKNSEFHAAMGLCNFNHISEIIKDRKRIYMLYKKYIKNDSVSFQVITNQVKYNFSYCPVVFSTKELLDQILNRLNQENIFPRRYFYPSLNNLPYINDIIMENSESISERILCLPSYFELPEQIIKDICNIINTQN